MEQKDDISFESLNLNRDLLKGIYSCDLFVMSEVQKKVIPEIIKRNNILVQSNSGTGKTFTFLIGAMSLIDKALEQVQVIIVADTRELAHQITTDAYLLNEFLNLKIALCAGKLQSLTKNIETIKGGCHMIIGTPGRISDLINRHIIMPFNLKLIILDEADKLLTTKSLQNEVENILDFSRDAQKAFFSATIPNELKKRYNLKYINLCDNLACDNISQFYIICKNISLKIIKLETFISKNIISQAIIFTNTCEKANFIYEYLKNKEYKVLKITGKMDQAERNKAMELFRSENYKFLVASNLIARGIDIPSVNLIINYDLPTNKDVYIHRIGRCGRFGSRGVSISLVINNDLKYIEELEIYMNKKIQKISADVDISQYLND